MTKKELLKIQDKVEELEDFDSWAYIGRDEVIEVDGLKIYTKDQFGGEGQGDSYWAVLSVIDKNGEETFWKIPGWYQSHAGSELEFENIYQVVEKEKVITVWVDAKTLKED